MSFLPPPPNLVVLADITLNAAAKGGRESAIAGEYFDCLASYYGEYRPCRILLEGIACSPGQTRRCRVQFVCEWDYDGARQAERFDLFDNHIIYIGQCVVIPPTEYFQPPRD